MEEKQNLSAKRRCLSAEQFMKKAQERIGQIKSSGVPVTLIALDFDNFNYINDLYGYEAGDHILKEICGHFNRILQEKDFFCRQHSGGAKPGNTAVHPGGSGELRPKAG